MESIQDPAQSPAALRDRLTWHRPVLQRLEISTETKNGGTSFDDGDGLGLIIQDGGP